MREVPIVVPIALCAIIAAVGVSTFALSMMVFFNKIPPTWLFKVVGFFTLIVVVALLWLIGTVALEMFTKA